jgi:hypothetical protein
MPGSRHGPQLVVEQLAPETEKLQACLSVVRATPVHASVVALPPAAQTGVEHDRVWLPVRSQLPGEVCMHADQSVHVVVPHVAPAVEPTVHIWLCMLVSTTHAPLVHVCVVDERVCVPVVAHVAPTMHADQSVTTGVPQGIPSVDGRVHVCVSSTSVGTHVPPLQAEVVVVRSWTPMDVQGSVPKSQADQSP